MISTTGAVTVKFGPGEGEAVLHFSLKLAHPNQPTHLHAAGRPAQAVGRPGGSLQPTAAPTSAHMPLDQQGCLLARPVKPSLA